jgi:hypothetical protein
MTGENGTSGPVVETADPGTAATESDGRVVATAQGAVEAVRAASETVDDQLVEIDDRTAAQAGDMESVVSDVSSLSATTEEIASTADEAARRTERAAADADEGYEAAKEALAVMEEIGEIGTAVADDVERLEERLDRIETVLAGISDIADQTNMLALNASIEAARAGSGDGGASGDGFAVVADEVKSLAEESQAQADEVEQILDEVRAAATTTVDRLDRVVEAVEEGTTQVETAIESVGDVAEAVETTADDVAQVSDVTDEQARTSERVAEQCEQASVRAEGIEADVERIRTARADQTAMLREIETTLAAVGETDLDDGPRLSTGDDEVDDRCGGGLIEGGRGVVTYDGDALSVERFVARCCGQALADGYAVSVTPPPGLGRATFESVLESIAGAPALADALAADRLFVLDAFDAWSDRQNVFDLGTRSLADANRATDRRRDRPLLVVGNIAGEIEVLGEAEARAARYENDGSLLGDRDTVLNVVDSAVVEETTVAFYAGAADQVLRFRSRDGRRRVVTETDGSSDERSHPTNGRAHTDE